MNNIGLALLFVFALTSVNAQNNQNIQTQPQTQPQQPQEQPQPEMERDTSMTGAQPAAIGTEVESPLDTMDADNFQRFKADGVAAVVGEYLVLESDIHKMRADIENRMEGEQNITDCQLLGSYMENKLFSHAAMQDSTVYDRITEAGLKDQVDQQIQQFAQELGGMEEVIEYYRLDSEKELKDELLKINKERQLSEAMQDKITEDVEVTPEEVRDYFNSLEGDEVPEFNDEVEYAHIRIDPEVPQSEIDRVVDRLNEMRTDILNGSSFQTKAVLYSEDGSSVDGGKMTITKKDPLDKEFKEVAFSLNEGEVSKPFKSTFGYHIVQVDKILGQERNIRHIILVPKPLDSSFKTAKEKTDSIRKAIDNGEISFEEAAKKYSDDEETRENGGQLINPKTGDTHFELTDIDPRMYSEVKRLEKGEVSKVLSDQTQTGQRYYKIITLTGNYPAHKADYAQDYSKIKEIALDNKRLKAIQKWRNEQIEDTYIKINGDYSDCDFKANWIKN